jgi:hypothetical protein
MHILYVDDSGDVGNASDTVFVLGGISVFERGIYHLIKAADGVVESFGLDDDVYDLELHGSPMYSGRAVWRGFQRSARERMIQRALEVVGGNRSVRLFAVAVDRAAVSPRDPVEVAFEELCNRFNLFLQRMNNRQINSRPSESQRGLLVIDNMKHEKPLQALARHFRANGGRWGHFRNLAEVPLFVDSKASRLVQLADLVAFATWRRYEHQDGRFFEPLIPHFDTEGGVIHGLFHHRRIAAGLCYCPACASRQQRILTLRSESQHRGSPFPIDEEQPP